MAHEEQRIMQALGWKGQGLITDSSGGDGSGGALHERGA